MSPEKHFQAPNASIEPNDPASPARNLLAAVLCRALTDVLNKPDTEDQLKETYFSTWRRKAEAWFRNNDIVGPTNENPNTGMSFCWICEHLSLSPNKVRQFLKQAQRDGKKFDAGINRTLEGWEVVEINKRKKQPISELL